MTKSTINQGVSLVFIFFGIWFALSQIDWVKTYKNWVKTYKVQEMIVNAQEKLEERFWEALKKEEKVINNSYVTNSLDSIVTHICKSNNIKRENIKVHVIKRDEINAFVLPYGHLIIYSGLINNSGSQEMLAGVICHEMAHIELNHIKTKLVMELGISVLISMTTGNSGMYMIKKVIKLLSSSAFDRNLEKEADITAVDYLIAAKVDPEPFATFFYELLDKEGEETEYLSWISTHHEHKERADYIFEYYKDKTIDYKPILSNKTWNNLRRELMN